MKIVIATGVFSPDIGGPTHYIEELAVGLQRAGLEVKVLTYSDVKSGGNYGFPVIRVSRKRVLLWRYLLFFLKLLFLSKKADAIYAFDLLSSGLPAALVKKITGRKLILRVSGDFIWEKSVQKEWTKVPLRLFYKQKKNLRERLSIYLVQKVFNQVDRFVFTTDFQKEITLKAYKINQSKIEVIANPFPEKVPEKAEIIKKRIVFAGRFIKLKNIELLIEAFCRVSSQHPSLELELIGQGPEQGALEKNIKELDLKGKVILRGRMSHQDLIKEINQSFLVVIPSLSEVSPNLALECIKLKKPVILTRETGFYHRFKDSLVFTNPFEKKDLIKKIELLLNEENYSKYQEAIALIPTDYSWPEVVKQHLSILKVLA